MKILLCESEEVLLTALKFRLTKKGYELLLASDAESAKSLLLSEKPNFIISAINFPDLSALELLTLIKDNFTQDIPMIISGDTENADEIFKALKAGANDFILKPFKPVEILMRIESVLLKQ